MSDSIHYCSKRFLHFMIKYHNRFSGHLNIMLPQKYDNKDNKKELQWKTATLKYFHKFLEIGLVFMYFFIL